MNEVLFVGTSDAFGAGGRRQSAIVVRGERGSMLLDCGATTNTGLEDLGVSRDEIDTIVVSHFHGDHFGGIPLFLLGALYEDQRRHALHIAGPRDIEARVRALAASMGHSMEDQKWNFPLRFSEIPPGERLEIGPAALSSFATQHQVEAHPQGYRVGLGSAEIVYTGDTGWFDELPRLSAGADLLITECTLRRQKLDFHLNLEQLTENKRRFDVRQIVLTHLGREMSALRGEIDAFDTADDGLLIRL